MADAILAVAVFGVISALLSIVSSSLTFDERCLGEQETALNATAVACAGVALVLAVATLWYYCRSKKDDDADSNRKKSDDYGAACAGFSLVSAIFAIVGWIVAKHQQQNGFYVNPPYPQCDLQLIQLKYPCTDHHFTVVPLWSIDGNNANGAVMISPEVAGDLCLTALYPKCSDYASHTRISFVISLGPAPRCPLSLAITKMQAIDFRYWEALLPALTNNNYTFTLDADCHDLIGFSLNVTIGET